jgi:putative hemolysin
MLFAGCLIAACGSAAQDTAVPTQAGLPNPASAFCEEQGGRLEIRQDASGNQAGICVFSDGSECDEWAYFRNECRPGYMATLEAAPTEAPAVEPGAPAPEGWKVYTHPTLGFSFLYPEDCTFVSTDTARYTAVVGPLVNADNWPWFTINYPDEPGYHPPADVDLQVWLAERSRLPGKVVATRQIAGQIAVHTRFEDPRGPQSYNDDRYYLVHDGQLYEIVIMHTGKEDWSVYDVFLDCFAFQE